MPERTPDAALEESTNRWLKWGFGIMVLMVAIFPLYRAYEPGSRAEARETHSESLAAQGRELWSVNCAACHGADGEGGVGPALNSTQFLTSARDDQIRALIAVGVPGSQMNAYAIDYGGPLTSEQIEALTVYLRGLEANAPDVPGWQDPLGAQNRDTVPPTTTSATTTTPPTSTTGAPTSTTSTTSPSTSTTSGGVTEEVLALGKEVWEVSAGGIGCALCHGIDATGSGSGPSVIGSDKSEIAEALAEESAMAFITLTADELEAVAQYLRVLSEGG